MNEQNYKTFRVNIKTTTLLDDFAPILIDDIADQLQPFFKLKEDYCCQLERNCNKLESFSEVSALATTLREYINKLKDDFSDCEQNVKYFTLVFMGAVSAGKTSMICDFLNVNPDQINEALRASKNFQDGSDDVLIADQVATTNVYEFLVDASHIRLVDVPGTGGVVHDNTTLAPFVNKADCLIFLSNAQSDLTGDDYAFLKRHIVGLADDEDVTPENASNKKVLIVVNKWNTVTQALPDDKKKKQRWERKKEWILWGDSKKEKGGKFNGLSELFKRTLTIVPAATSQRDLDEDTGRYEQYTDPELSQVIDALKDILKQEGIEVKLERPKIILKHSLSKVQETLDNERTKQSVDELVKQLEKMGMQVSLDSNTIMLDLISRLGSLQNRLKSDLFYQIKSGIDQWQPNVSLKNRIMGLWAKEWWGSNKFGAKAAQEEIKAQWKTEIEALLRDSIKPDEIRRTVRDEADSIGRLLEATFRAQLAELQNQILKDKLSKGASLQSFDGSSFSFTGSSRTLETAVNSAVSEIQRSIVDDIIGIITVDAVIATLIGAILTPVGSAVFLAIRRWMSGHAEEKKAKRNIDDQIWGIANDVSSQLQEQVANKLRGSLQKYMNSITQVIEGETKNLSKLTQALDEAIATVKTSRERLENLSK
jgi:uncharacterized protein YqgV (UPF0045/DUF77 family)